MAEPLPFVRFDVVDRDLTVVLSGATPERLAPATAARLEPELECEVCELLRDARRGGRSVRTGLVGLEYGVRLLEHPGSPDAVLVCTQRISIRGAFERLAHGHDLAAVDLEHVRLLAGGYIEASIARRLGLSLASAALARRAILHELGLPNRSALVRRVFARESPRVTAPASRLARATYLRQA